MSDSESAESIDQVLSVSPSPVPSSGFLCAVGRPRKSPVWDYFLYDSGTNKSTCQVLACASSSEICGHSLAGKYPTNLKLHLKKVHPEEYKEVERKEGEFYNLAVTHDSSVD